MRLGLDIKTSGTEASSLCNGKDLLFSRVGH